MYYIGVDGGGTKTAFGLFDSEGKQLDEIKLSTCHFLQVGYENCATILKQGIEMLVTKYRIPAKEVYIGIGIAGYGNDIHIRQHLETHIKSALSVYNYTLSNDVHVALIGALNGNDGIVIIAGTGSIAMAQCNNELLRCGGWGYCLGDEGSAYWIGKQMLYIFCQQADGRQEKSSLYHAIMEHFSLDDPYQIIKTYSSLDNERTKIATLALLCDNLATQGDISCIRILEQAGKELAMLANPLLSHFDTLPLITYYGGVFNNNIVKQRILEDLASKATIIEPTHNALIGAYLLAKHR